MADPIGEGTYNGLAVPLYGESKIVQKNSSNAILSLQHSSHDAGRFLLGTDVRSSGTSALNEFTSILTNLAVFDIDGDGGYRGLSGTTILMELNSSIIGNVGGTSATIWNIDSSGVWTGLKKTITTVTTGANYTIATSESGTLFLIGDSSGTSMYMLLPGDAPVGTWYEFWLTSAATTALGGFNITSTAGAGRIHMSGLVSSVVSSAKSIQNASTDASVGVKLTKIETDIWIAVGMGYQHSTGDTTDITIVDLRRGVWQDGSTIA